MNIEKLDRIVLRVKDDKCSEGAIFRNRLNALGNERYIWISE